MREVESRNTGCRRHGEAAGQRNANARLRFEQAEQGFLLGVFRLARIAGSRPDAAILLLDQFRIGQVFIGSISPQLLANTLMHVFRHRLCKPVSQRLDHNGGIIVASLNEVLRNFLRIRT